MTGRRFDIVSQVLDCSRCDLRAQCTAPVPFRGDAGVRIAIVGEAPGATEDTVGKPFVGAAGKLLGRILRDVGINERVGVCNTVSCFPHGTPDDTHIAACEDNKWAQINHLDPRIVLLLGRVALRGMREDLELSRVRGRTFTHRDRLMFASYHPAAALRNGEYEDRLRSDLAVFCALVADLDQWITFIPDRCAACSATPEAFEATGLGWCEIHMPPALAVGYEARRSLIAAELDAARARASRQRDDALDAVEAAADPGWLAAAWTALVEFLRTHDEFFVDDFWAETGLARPAESRALGPVVARAAKDGLMRKNGRFRKSVASHMTEKPIWDSLIVGKRDDRPVRA